MQSRTRFAAIALLCAATSPLVAQETARFASPGSAAAAIAAPSSDAVLRPASEAAAPTLPSLAPTLAHTAVGARRAATSPVPVVAPRRADSSRSRALMIVGGAALIVGAVIGHTEGQIIMVGGGVTGLIGLYQYLQ